MELEVGRRKMVIVRKITNMMYNNFFTNLSSKLKIEKEKAYFPKQVKNGSSKTEITK